MFKDPFHWFPDPFFSDAFVVIFFGVYIVDSLVPRFFTRGNPRPNAVGDRWSFQIIQTAGIIAFLGAVGLRYYNLGVGRVEFQYAGLVIAPLGLLFREWAIIKLGRFFSRVVEIGAGHQLITDGPYRWIRHPAYTGMIAIYVGLALALGTWLGALMALAVMLAATIYRMRVEEQALLTFFGDAYRDYLHHTWRLLPGW